MNLDEIFQYWQKQYGKWPEEEYKKYLEEYQGQVAKAGRQWGLPKTDEEALDVYYFLRSRTKVPTAPGWSADKDKCAPGCTVHGTCNQELGRCDCPRGRTGADCSTPLATSCRQYCQHEGQCIRFIREWCINECNGRGTCMGGFCHCWPGYYGTDCSLSLDSQGRPELLEGQGYRPNPRGPKIYIYEFPPEYHVWTLTWVDRPLNIMLWERFTSLGLRTADPEEADYFFLAGCGRGCNRWDDKFQYIMDHYSKYWNRRQGRDHLMTQPGDWGRCEPSWSPAKSGAFVANLTLLSHWGITADRSKEVDHPLFKACHIPNQDIVVPPQCPDLYNIFEHNVWHPDRRTKPVHKTVLASVAGSLCAWNSNDEPPCPNKFYSFGVRAALWELLRDKPGFHITKRVPNQGISIAESEFCFAPTGAGWGKRAVMSTTLGCIPVIISDYVAQPYEPFLNWNDFGVWIPEAHMKDTEAILRGFTPEQKAEKMVKLYCASRHLAWTSVFGGLYAGDTGQFDAMATLVRILRARRDHPGVPDHQLAQVDPDFADFLACKASGAAAAGAAASAVIGTHTSMQRQPPAPPLPRAHDVIKAHDSKEHEWFPERTVTTMAWIHAANGQGGDQPADGAKSDDAGKKALAKEDELQISGPLCLHNGRGLFYASHDQPEPTDDVIKHIRGPEQCMPLNLNRPGNFFRGGSVTCPPAGPITKCAVLV
ncbi:hypothetical protein HYH03_016938 [Edaphochlamys debaryana]|uniref:EGF-like domain-containing protein n=1 Tax=Edaphochlamys debaryana TaxID=47281 RepID=A0A835XHI9_9CHLO|nr:hypothetical protein HYH03_016938 [Edaphochlamys debaryana]|eukprot:KAG2484203.1 hypothetical protein HYH03_016938 [Edaphochlamys debaryana]